MTFLNKSREPHCRRAVNFGPPIPPRVHHCFGHRSTCFTPSLYISDWKRILSVPPLAYILRSALSKLNTILYLWTWRSERNQRPRGKRERRGHFQGLKINFGKLLLVYFMRPSDLDALVVMRPLRP